jgi:hypothetical protein
VASPTPSDMVLHVGRAMPPLAHALAPVNRNSGHVGNGNHKRGKGKAVQQNGDAAGSSSDPSSTGGQVDGCLVQLPAPATNLWMGMVHAWPMPWRPHMTGVGVLGPRPGAPSPFAGHAAQYMPPLRPRPLVMHVK